MATSIFFKMCSKIIAAFTYKRFTDMSMFFVEKFSLWHIIFTNYPTYLKHCRYQYKRVMLKSNQPSEKKNVIQILTIRLFCFRNSYVTVPKIPKNSISSFIPYTKKKLVKIYLIIFSIQFSVVFMYKIICLLRNL